MDAERESLIEQLRPFRIIASLLVIMVTFSTVLFHYVEHWDWLDSYYFTIVTVATVGYGDYTPHTDIGKIAATLLILFGIGLFGAFASLLLKRRTLKNIERREKTSRPN